jgi:hypothetical protein
MQLHTGAEHMGNVGNRGILKHGCSYCGCCYTYRADYISQMSQNCDTFSTAQPHWIVWTDLLFKGRDQ